MSARLVKACGGRVTQLLDLHTTPFLCPQAAHVTAARTISSSSNKDMFKPSQSKSMEQQLSPTEETAPLKVLQLRPVPFEEAEQHDPCNVRYDEEENQQQELRTLLDHLTPYLDRMEMGMMPTWAEEDNLMVPASRHTTQVEQHEKFMPLHLESLSSWAEEADKLRGLRAPPQRSSVNEKQLHASHTEQLLTRFENLVEEGVMDGEWGWHRP